MSDVRPGKVLRTAGILLSGLAVVSVLAVVPPALADDQPGPAGAVVDTGPAPVVTGPVTGGLHGRPWFAAPFKPADHGYTEQEYFVAGTARAFGADRPPAPYVTRILVYRPADPARFSGKAVVEWNNVTSQMDAPIDFIWLHPQILAEGDAYVQVTAQQVGVCGMRLTGAPPVTVGPLAPSVCTPVSLKGYDPLRYGRLVHPGDDYAFDIFTQAARAIRDPHGVSPLGDLHVQRVIAIGQSQSAVELDKYLTTGADAAARIFDGFVIDSGVQHALPATYRVPTLHLWSEESAQPVTETTGPNHAIWSVAGPAHFDAWALQYLISVLPRSFLSLPALSLQLPTNSPGQQGAFERTAGNYGQEGPGPSATCAGGSQFPRRYAVDAALTAVDRWIQTGTPAPGSPPLVFTGLRETARQFPTLPVELGIGTEDVNFAAIAAIPFALARDGYGNALGGLRLPVITVPVASYNGSICFLLGTTTPLPPPILHKLYPTHEDYVTKMLTATTDAVQSSYLTPRDGIDLMQRACNSAIPGWGATPPDRQPAACKDLTASIRGGLER